MYCVLQILGLYHDSILAKAAKKVAKFGSSFRSSVHNRYTQHLTQHSRLYRHVSLILTLTRYTELLWEMIVKKKYGEKARWKLILMIESLKSIIRLLLLVNTRRILPSNPIPEREFDPEKISEDEQSVEMWEMPRLGQGLNHKTPASVKSIDEYLTTKVLKAEDVKSPIELIHVIASNKALIGEIIYIVRPLIYAYMLYSQLHKKDKSKLRTWSPWIVGIALEYISKRMLTDLVEGRFTWRDEEYY